MANDIKYLNSSKVKIFPTAFRGKDANGHVIDPQAFMTTEENLVNITNKVTHNHKNYFYEEQYNDNTVAHIILDGYYFTASKSDITALFTSPSNNDIIYACIDEKPMQTSYEDVSVQTLSPHEGSAGDILDVTETNSAQEFKGLAFTKNTTSGFNIYLELYKYDSNDNVWKEIPTSMVNISATQIGNGTGSTPITQEFSTSNLAAINTGIQNLYGYSTSTISVYGNLAMTGDIIPEKISGNSLVNLGGYEKYFDNIYGRNLILNAYTSSGATFDMLYWSHPNVESIPSYIGSVNLLHFESGLQSSYGGLLNISGYNVEMNNANITGVNSLYASSMYAGSLSASSLSLSGEKMFVSVKNATLKTSSDIYMDASKRISFYASYIGLYASSNVNGNVYGNISIYANENIDIVAEFSSGNTHYGSLLLSAYSTVEIRTGDQSSGKILFAGSVYAPAIHNVDDFRIDVLDTNGSKFAGYLVDEYTGTYITEKNSGRSINLSASGGMLSLYAGSSMTLSASYSINLLAGYSIHLSTGSSIYLDTKTSKIYLGNTGSGGTNIPIYINTSGKISPCSIYISAGANTASPTRVSYAAYASSGFNAATSPLSISDSDWKVFPNTLFITATQVNSIFTINVNCYQNVGGWMRFDVWYLLNACGIPYGNFNYEYFACNISPRMDCFGSAYQPVMAWAHDTTANYKRYIYAYESPNGPAGANIGANGFAMTITLRANDNFYN